jgi:hypothetical protein
MPVHRGKDNIGVYYAWGNQKRYYYITNNKVSRKNAKKKASLQGRAIKSTGWKEK